MIGIHKLNISWSDDNHCNVQDPDNGNEFDVTIRKHPMFSANGFRVKPRLYIDGMAEKEEELGRRKFIDFAKEHFGYTLAKIVNQNIRLSFRSKAGCSCGCSPGFIIEEGGESFPFDVWMTSKN